MFVQHAVRVSGGDSVCRRGGQHGESGGQVRGPDVLHPLCRPCPAAQLPLQ